MRAPFSWGLRRDCTVACVAFSALHGTDPLGRCDVTYSTKREAYRIVTRAGGYLAWCRATIELPTTETPGPGDLALIESCDPLGAAMALCIKPGEFASKTETGLMISHGIVLEAWTCRSSPL